jgi:hypothetical protein
MDPHDDTAETPPGEPWRPEHAHDITAYDAPIFLTDAPLYPNPGGAPPPPPGAVPERATGPI